MPVLRSLVALLACASLSWGADLHKLAGTTVAGDLVAISEKGVTLRTSAGPVTTPLAEVLAVDLQHEMPLTAEIKYTDIELTDGSLLHCGRVTLKGKELEVKLAVSDLTLKVPLTSVAYLLNEANEPAIRQEWQEKHLAKRRTQDILAIKLEGVINGLEGTLGEGNEQGQIAFEYGAADDRKKKEIDLARVQGLIFQRSLAGDAPSPLCRVYDVNQNLWVASKLELGPSGFTVSAVAGPSVQYPKQAIARLDFNNDKVVFLSDLKPVEQIEKSRQGRKDNVHLDKNLENGSLQLRGDTFAKGLALHSHTELVYALDGKYKTLEAKLGMDDLVGGDGQPLVKIEADGKELFARAVSRKDERRELKLDVAGVRQLRITVTSTGLFDFGDHVDLADAKLSK